MFDIGKADIGGIPGLSTISGLIGLRKAYANYAFYFVPGPIIYDHVSKQVMPPANYDTPHHNLINGELVEYSEDEYVRDADGRILTYGEFTEMCQDSYTPGNWELNNVTKTPGPVIGPFVSQEFAGTAGWNRAYNYKSGTSGAPAAKAYFAFYYDVGTSGHIKLTFGDVTAGTESNYSGVIGSAIVVSNAAGILTRLSDTIETEHGLSCRVVRGTMEFINYAVGAQVFAAGIGPNSTEGKGIIVYGAQFLNVATYRPFTPTSGANGVVSATYSDDADGGKGPRLQLIPDEIGSVYTGALVGDELVIPITDHNTTTLLNITADTFDFINPVGTDLGHLINGVFVVGESYEVSLTVTFSSPGAIRLAIGNTYVTDYITESGEYTVRGICSFDDKFRFVSYDVGVAGTVIIHHIKKVSRNLGMPLAIDALDGVADGTVVLDDDFSTDTSGNYTRVGLDTLVVISGFLQGISNDITTGGLAVLSLLTISKNYKTTFRARSNRALAFSKVGGINYSVGTTIKNPVLTTDWQDYEFRGVATGTTFRAVCGSGGSLGDYFDFDNIIVQEISPAVSEWSVEWTPNFSAGDVAGNVGLLTGSNTVADFLFFDATNSLLKLTDGTNTAEIACTPVSGTKIEIGIKAGDNSGYKMQIGINGTYGTAVTFAERFLVTADDFMLGYKTTFPQEFGKILTITEPKSWA